eukprot:gene16353-54218_t
MGCRHSGGGGGDDVAPRTGCAALPHAWRFDDHGGIGGAADGGKYETVVPAAVPPAVVSPLRRRRGLANLGNTCYMNSVLQALFATDVAPLFASVVPSPHTGGRVADAFAGVMRDMAACGGTARDDGTIAPHRLKGGWGGALRRKLRTKD